MSDARVKVCSVSLCGGTVKVVTSGLTADEARLLQTVIDNRVRRFAKNLNGMRKENDK